jgi:hypothetical protein
MNRRIRRLLTGCIGQLSRSMQCITPVHFTDVAFSDEKMRRAPTLREFPRRSRIEFAAWYAVTFAALLFVSALVVFR